MTLGSSDLTDASLEVVEMAEIPFKATAKTARSPRQALLTLVREACDTLVNTDPSVVGDIILSRTLDDASAASVLGTMAVRLAQEYGVAADVRTDGKAVVVRLTRDGHIHEDRGNGQHASQRDEASHHGSRGR